MKRMTILCAILLLLILAITQTAAASEDVSFQGQLDHPNLSSVACGEDQVCLLVFEGTGTVNIMGRVAYHIEIMQDFSVTPCNPDSGEATIIGATGTIMLTEVGMVCQGANPVGLPTFISGSWEIVGGTGEFSGISGSGIDAGPITPGIGPVVHFQGQVSY